MKKTLLFLLILVFGGFQCQTENEDAQIVRKSIEPTNIIFSAYGEDPKWEITIGASGVIQFISKTEISEVNFPNSKETPIMDVAARSYVAETESANIRVEIIKEECVNQLSLDTLSFRTRVMVKNSGKEKFTEFLGCGKYLPDYRLNDIWVLERLNGKEVDKTLFENKQPYFEIHIKDSRVLGYAGCNNFNGKFTFEGPDIRFSKNMAMTMMACPNLEFESEFVRSLTRSSLKHSFIDNKLVLSRGDVELVFKKVD